MMSKKENKNKNKLGVITTALFLLLGMGSASAVLITATDQVSVDDKEWAKVDIFGDLRWDIISAQREYVA